MKNEENEANPLLDQVVALQQQVGELDDKVNHYEQQLAQERETRQTVETRLQKTEERLSLVLRATKDAIYECDLEQGIISWNAPYKELLGDRPESTAYSWEWWIEHLHPDDREEVVANFQETLAGTGDRWGAEYRYQKTDGSYAHILDRGYILRNQTGKAIRVIGTLFDATTQKQVEAELRQQEECLRLANERFQFAARAVNALIYDWQITRNRVERTDGLTSILGYSLSEAEPTLNWWRDRIHPDDGERIDQETATALSQGDSYRVEYRVLHKSNHYIHILDQGLVVTRDDQGHPIRVIGSTIDISDRKATEATLKQRETDLRLITDAVPALIAYVDSDCRYRFVNRAFTTWFGHSAENLIGQSVADFVGAEVYEYMSRDIEAALAGEPINVEMWMPFKDGGSRYVRRQYIPDIDPQGHVKGFYAFINDITDLKQIEAALRDREQRFSTLFNGMEDWVLVYPLTADNQPGQLIEVNEPACKRLGYTRQELLTLSVADILDIPLADLQVSFQKLLQEKRVVVESVHRTKAGQQIPVEVSSTLFMLDGLPTVQSICRDITERKQAELALRKSETVLNAFIASSPIGIAFFDHDLRYLYANEALATMNGVPLSQHLGRTLWEVVPQMAPEFAPMLDQILQTRQPRLNFEFSGEVQPGIYCHALANHFPVCLPDGELLGVGVTIMEISELKRVEGALRLSEAFAHARVQELETLMEITPAALWIAHDPDCHQMTANRTAYNLMRMPLGSVTTATPVDGSYPLPFKQYKNGQEYIPEDLPMQRAARTGQEVIDEIEFVFEDGTVRFIYGKAVPLYHDSGEVRGVIGAFVDITERKQAEREHEQLLARERAAREEAESANRIKDEFLAILSHELRSPLNPILGWTKLLRTRQFDPAATDKALATIERNATIQIQLVDDLLDVARILRGKVVLTRHRVDLAIAIKAAIETVQLAAEAKSIQIQPHFIGKVGLVEGDSGRLQQVVWNLLSNAVKFTPSGGQVEVTLATVDEFAQITVKDTGIGISADILPHIFDYFRQADSSMTRQFGGLGLGLAIARHLVDLHGGIIQADSPGEGQGATFTVRLALLPDKKQRIRLNTHDCQGTSNTTPLKGIRVLVVDDEVDTRELLRIILQQAGAEVITMASAQEVLSQFNQLTIDILVSDIGMPQMNGYLLLQQIRGMSLPQANVAAIALTAYAGKSNQQKALAAGFQQHLAKPIDPNDLIKAIARLVEQRNK
ncbi:PAS fold family [Coleofasciculus chthonoplastes PCC 7420]|uniref:histidine kinase n=1 Tax=Coleofasciculus chthonoplastes PCC 7420 TaxID=118168 RepID=B4VUS1_9CYAN|nr:PAS domain S-box protein [Coleofasciculus chthonoplastes]EDX74410.1 PAS fold family [Coleofasciculus chthonoplastes PCC 7420]